MITIYAKTLNPANYHYERYDISYNEGNDVYIDGGRDFCDVDNKDYLMAIRKIIEYYNCYYSDGSLKDLFDDMLPKKENGKRLSPKEIHLLKTALDNEKDKETYCQFLTVITGKKYEHRGLRGSCQGDYVEAYYPIRDNIDEYLAYVEAWYFGTGTEVEVSEEDANSPEEVDGWTFYTASWNVEDLKKEIKAQCGYKEEDEVEVKLWLFDTVQVIHKNIYKEAE